MNMQTTSTERNLEKFGYEQSLNRVLGLGSLIFYGLAYLAPLTIFTTYGLITNMTHGMLALTYLVATIAMALTALSYSQMVKAYPIAGSAYSYAQRAINPHIGFLAGWAILMDYLLIPMINYLVAALFLQPIFPNVPAWVWILGYILIVTIINLVGIQITAWINNGLVIIQFVFLLAFLLFLGKWIATGNGAGTFFDWSAFFNTIEFHQDGVGWGAILAGASILALSFLGFDAVTTVVEEAKEPEKNVGKAIIITCLGAGAVFVIVAYLCQLAWPTGWNEYESVDTGAYELIAKVAGGVMGYLFTAAYCIACLASAMASQASASRILFGMGRDGALPKKFFAHINSKFHTPTYNILLIGIISLVAIKLSLAAAASLINFGALIGFTLVNLSVVAYYFIRNKRRSGIDILLYLILPLTGAATTFTIWFNLDVHSKILGFSWLAVGIIYLAINTRGFTKLPPELKLEE
ncbi:MAG TPA: APC family permease [Anaerovoracaceae bacterium]|nr:APC family permease [Anaerovoracaceae bacterium]